MFNVKNARIYYLGPDMTIYQQEDKITCWFKTLLVPKDFPEILKLPILKRIQIL